MYNYSIGFFKCIIVLALALNISPVSNAKELPWLPQNAPIQFVLSFDAKKYTLNIKIKNNSDKTLVLNKESLETPSFALAWNCLDKEGKRVMKGGAGSGVSRPDFYLEKINNGGTIQFERNQVIEKILSLTEWSQEMRMHFEEKLSKLNQPHLKIIVMFINLEAASYLKNERCTTYAPHIEITDLKELWPSFDFK